MHLTTLLPLLLAAAAAVIALPQPPNNNNPLLLSTANGGRPVPEGACCVEGTDNSNIKNDRCIKANGQVGRCGITATAACGTMKLVCG
ncbi:hypothetical protein HYALB_00012940 [Hymenoscyphus albidus]|uniref:Hydrophobin n=1 Tax=Hymenoscyphus albidus TaxID=595503 RepID=A0A9N9QB65_9HELO|nr:hypothetical protein HYALB_00012940 [Hymenoscyphus albidus]